MDLQKKIPSKDLLNLMVMFPWKPATIPELLMPLRSDWQMIPDIGRTGSGMTITPVTANKQTPGAASPRLEYDMLVFDTGKINVQALFFSHT